MSKNLKQFLEADALRTQGEWENHCGVIWVPDVCVDPYGELEQYQNHIADSAGDNANFIAAASKVPNDIRQLIAAFEQVCEALASVRDEYDLTEGVIYESVGKMRAALTAAAPYRKLMEEV